MDLGKYLCHWITVAWQQDASCHIVDYGRIEVASVDLGVERALMLALVAQVQGSNRMARWQC